MSKRFADTKKFRKAWFRALSPRLKCAWDFLCLECDHAGIWEIDLDSMAFHIGEPVTLEEIRQNFEVEEVGEDKLFLPGFIEFQYGNLNPENRVHKSILDRVEKLKIKGLARPLKGPMEMDMELELEKEEEPAKEKIEITPDRSLRVVDDAQIKKMVEDAFEDLYRMYPLKKGKSKGLKSCRSQIKSNGTYEQVKLAITRYRDQVALERTDPKYIKHFDTFMNCWRDYLDDDVGTSEMQPTGICGIGEP